MTKANLSDIYYSICVTRFAIIIIIIIIIIITKIITTVQLFNSEPVPLNTSTCSNTELSLVNVTICGKPHILICLLSLA